MADARASTAERAERIATYGAVLLGLALRIRQFVESPAQWLDEAMLSSSIVQFDALRLLKGALLYGQSAPPGYLLLERALVFCLGPADWVLRAFPFACSLFTLLATVPLSRKLLHGVARPIAVALVATAAPFILFAGQAKQYSSDVAMTVLLLWLACELLERPAARGLRSGALLVGVLAPWVSLPAVFTLVAICVTLVHAELRSHRAAGRLRAPRLSTLLLVGVWGLTSLAALRFNRTQVTPEMLRTLYEYWEGAFMPRPPPWSATLLWPLRALSRIFYGKESAGLYYPLRGVFVAFMAVGFYALARRSARAPLLLGVPIALALLAAMLRQYPFADRLVLFLVPNLLLAVAAGIGWTSGALFARLRPAGVLLAGASCSLAFFPALVTPAPYVAENIKPLLERLAQRRLNGDPLYVYCGGLPAYSYYAELGRAPRDFTAGACSQDQRTLFSNLDQLRGKPRAWVLFSHSLMERRQLENMRAYLDAIGTRLDETVIPARGPARGANGSLPAALYLYDLSNPAKGQHALATTFPVLAADDGQSGP